VSAATTPSAVVDHPAAGSIHEGTLLHFEGGHKTVIRRPITEVVHEVTAARQEGIDFVYVDSPSHGFNGFVIDPHKVVAFISTSSRL
jgi:hypothetical protein